MKSIFGAAMLVAVLVLSPLSAWAAPMPQATAPQQGPVAPDRFYVELALGDAADALALSQLIPDWDEAIEAGATQVILTQAEIDRLRSGLSGHRRGPRA